MKRLFHDAYDEKQLTKHIFFHFFFIFNQKKKQKQSQTRRRTARQNPPRKLQNTAATANAIEIELFEDCRRSGSFGETEGQSSSAVSHSFLEFEKNENLENTKIDSIKIGP